MGWPTVFEWLVNWKHDRHEPASRRQDSGHRGSELGSTARGYRTETSVIEDQIDDDVWFVREKICQHKRPAPCEFLFNKAAGALGEIESDDLPSMIGEGPGVLTRATAREEHSPEFPKSKAGVRDESAREFGVGPTKIPRDLIHFVSNGPRRCEFGHTGTVDMPDCKKSKESSNMRIERVGIVGGGQMGAGIAEVCAKAGVHVIVREVSQEAAAIGEGRITKSLDRAVSKGKMAEADRESAISLIQFTTDLEAMADRQLVIEAVVEYEPLKAEIFTALDRIVTADDAILATNTSSLPITRLATNTERPEQVIGMHFFNPVPVMKLMELITTVVTNPAAAAAAETFATDTLGKTVVKAKDRAGFVVNMLLVPYMTEAMRMYEAGHASAEDIDNGMKLGANHPMGPLELADFIGLDTMKLVADVLFDEYKLTQYAPPPLLVRMVEAGQLGRKTGQGFYTYD